MPCAMKELPFGLSFPAPAYVDAIPDAEKDARVVLEDDCCEIDGELFFVRARIQLPVSESGGSDAPVFEWRVWASVSAAAYVRLAESFATPSLDAPKPSVAFLSSRLPEYPDTLDLKAMLHPQTNDLPLLVLSDTDHPLADEQREGISIERVRALMRFAPEEA